MKTSARKKAKKRIQRDFCHDMILEVKIISDGK